MAIKRIYGTFRQYYTNRGVRYNPSFYLNNMYQDYLEAGLTKTIDNIIPENRYTAELAPGINKMTRFAVGEYDDTYVNGDEFKANIQAVGAQFNIQMFDTVDEAIAWIKANTDLVEDSNTAGKFELYPEHTDEEGNDIPATYLVIN